jgi:hypothetical protein
MAARHSRPGALHADNHPPIVRTAGKKTAASDFQ